MFKKVIFIIMITSPLSAIAPVISPSTPVVSARQTIQFTAQNSVTWSLLAGSNGSINSATGLYTAPSTATAHNVLAGCPALPNDHVYNTRIDNLPVDSNSTNRINNVASVKLGFEISFPINIMNNATPLTTMTFHYTTNSNGQAWPILPFPYTGVENAATPTNFLDGNQDRHQLGLNTDTCQFTEIYDKYPAGTRVADPSSNASSGVQYYAMSYELADNTNGNGGTTDAAGLYIQPLAMRYSELKAGVIKHALLFTLANGYILSQASWPATAFTNQCTNTTNCFPYGSRLRLKSSFQAGKFSQTAQVYLTALKQYGMFLADGGITFHIQTMYDVVGDTTAWYAILNELNVSSIGPENFEMVDESSLEESSFSGHVNLSNPYVTPDTFASVIATNNSDLVASTEPIAIQPVTVGFKNSPFPVNDAAINVQAGTPQFQIPVIINGSSDTVTTCTMSPTIGALTAGCLYTAPVSQVNVLSSATLTITPRIDSTQAFSFPIVVYPSDAIRVRYGPKSAANSPAPTYDTAGDLQDSAGKWWWDDVIGNNPGWYSRDDMYSPQASWGSSTDVNLFYTTAHGNSDNGFSMMVPNGNYNLNLSFGTDGQNNTVTNSSASIDTQGVVVSSATNLFQATYTPTTVTYPIQVTNNQFYFALRNLSTIQFPTLSHWSLIFISPLITGDQNWKGGINMKGGMSLK